MLRVGRVFGVGRLGMGCSPSSARYAPSIDEGAGDVTDLLVRKPSDGARAKPPPPTHLKEKRTASSSPTPSTGSVDAVSPVESPSPERVAAAPGESPQCPARVRASPSRTPSGSAKRRRGSVPRLRLELGVDAPVPEVSSNEEDGSDAEEDEGAYTREEVVHFAKTLLGLDPDADADLLWIAEEALRAPLPLGWVELEDPKTGPTLLVQPHLGICAINLSCQAAAVQMSTVSLVFICTNYRCSLLPLDC